MSDPLEAAHQRNLKALKEQEEKPLMNDNSRDPWRLMPWKRIGLLLGALAFGGLALFDLMSGRQLLALIDIGIGGALLWLEHVQRKKDNAPPLA